MSVADGTETVIEPPETDGPNGPELVPLQRHVVTGRHDAALHGVEQSGGTSADGVIAVPADTPSDATVLTDAIDPVPGYRDHQWVPIQMWGRQPG